MISIAEINNLKPGARISFASSKGSIVAISNTTIEIKWDDDNTIRVISPSLLRECSILTMCEESRDIPIPIDTDRFSFGCSADYWHAIDKANKKNQFELLANNPPHNFYDHFPDCIHIILILIIVFISGCSRSKPISKSDSAGASNDTPSALTNWNCNTCTVETANKECKNKQ